MWTGAQDKPASALLSVAVFGAAVLGEGALAAGYEVFDGIGQMSAVDMVIAACDADLVGFEQHIGVAHPLGRFEAVGGQFDA
jgi:hypothetical protein